jgi:hypothetical protein
MAEKYIAGAADLPFHPSGAGGRGVDKLFYSQIVLLKGLITMDERRVIALDGCSLRDRLNPLSTHSISCNASNQDVVSMGTVAARKALKAVSNAKHVLTLETLAQLQPFSFRNASGLGRGTAAVYALLNQHFRVYDNKRVFHDDLVQFRHILFSTPHFDSLERYYEPSL